MGVLNLNTRNDLSNISHLKSLWFLFWFLAWLLALNIVEFSFQQLLSINTPITKSGWPEDPDPLMEKQL